MQNKNTKTIAIIAAVLPALYAIAMLFMPFLAKNLPSVNSFGIVVTETDYLELYQLFGDSRGIVLALFIFPVVIMVVATLLGLIIRNKAAFIYECIASSITVIHGLALLVGLQSWINALVESDFGFESFFVKSDEITYSLAFGFWLALIFAAASVVMSLVALKLLNEDKTAAAPQSSAAPVQSAAASAVRSQNVSGAHQIVCISGEFANASFPLNPNETVVIGRDSAVSNIVIVAPKVSRKHCTVSFDPSKNMFIVVDCSTNGTYTENGTRLMANMNNPLPSGSVISLGSNENRFRLV